MRSEVKRSTLAPRRGRPQEAGTYTYPSQHIQQYRDCHDRLGGCRNGFGRHRSARMTSWLCGWELTVRRFGGRRGMGCAASLRRALKEPGGCRRSGLQSIGASLWRHTVVFGTALFQGVLAAERPCFNLPLFWRTLAPTGGA